jgi:hypothetical protein
MISASAIRSLALRTLILIVFATVANGQDSYAIRTVSGEPNYFLTATEGCADEIRKVQVENYDDHTVRWTQTFTLYDQNGGELGDGDLVFIKRCNRFLRIDSEGELKLMDNGPDDAAVFKIRKPRNDSNNANDKLVVFEVKSKPGIFLTVGDPKIGAGSDYLDNPRNVFKLIYKPNVRDMPSCEGEACGDVFIDGLGNRIFWTNISEQNIFIQRPGDYESFVIKPHTRGNGEVREWSSFYVLYKPKEKPQPSSPTAAPAPGTSNVCHGGPGIKIIIEAVSDHDLWLQVTNSQTKVSSRLVVDGGAIINYLATIKKAATNVGLVAEIIPNSQAIIVCGKDNVFNLHNVKESHVMLP